MSSLSADNAEGWDVLRPDLLRGFDYRSLENGVCLRAPVFQSLTGRMSSCLSGLLSVGAFICVPLSVSVLVCIYLLCVCVCLWIYLFVCVCVCVCELILCVCVCVSAFIFACVFVHTFGVYVCVCVCLCVYSVRVHACVSVCGCMCLCIYFVCVCPCVRACMCVRVKILLRTIALASPSTPCETVKACSDDCGEVLIKPCG